MFDLGVLSSSSGESLSLWATAADASPRMRRRDSGELARPTLSGWLQNHMGIDRPGRVGKNGNETKNTRFKSAILKPSVRSVAGTERQQFSDFICLVSARSTAKMLLAVHVFRRRHQSGHQSRCLARCGQGRQFVATRNQASILGAPYALWRGSCLRPPFRGGKPPCHGMRLWSFT